MKRLTPRHIRQIGSTYRHEIFFFFFKSKFQWGQVSFKSTFHRESVWSFKKRIGRFAFNTEPMPFLTGKASSASGPEACGC